MAKGYRPVDRDQPFLVPPDMREWLPEDHPVWLVIRVVDDHLDTSAFHARRKTGGAGTAGYDPDMLLTVLVWAYAQGVRSSRRIEALCATDVAFRVICAGNLPDHATFARFRAEFPDAVAALFAEILALCARLGMGRLGTVALDGMKIAANASKAANRTGEGLRKLAREAVAGHARADAEEDGLFGDGRGDEVPEEAWSPRRRDERIRRALADLEAERRAAAREAARKGPGPVRNLTDPASRLMPVRGGGFIQGYNAQNVTSEDGLVIATALTASPADTRWFEPMITAAARAAAIMAAAGGPGSGDIGLVLADAGYLSLDNLTCPGPDRL